MMSDAVEKRCVKSESDSKTVRAYTRTFRHQGMAASLVNTVVNYSISIGVGIAGTAEKRVNNGGQTEEDELNGYRGALNLGIGLSGLGVLTSLLFLWKMHIRKARAGPASHAADA